MVMLLEVLGDWVPPFIGSIRGGRPGGFAEADIWPGGNRNGVSCE
jgi:hypothetical protein